MKRSVSLILSIALLILVPILAAQEETPESKPDFNRRYLVLSTARHSTLEKELKEAVAAGYQPIMGDAAYKILLLEKKPESTPQREFIAVENLHRGLKDAAGEGFRVIPTTVGIHEYSLAGVVEKAPGSRIHYEYLVLQPARTSSLQKDILEAAAQGYRPVAFAAAAGHAVVMERPAGLTAQPKSESATSGPPYLLLATSRSSTLQNELNAAVDKGYHVLLGTGGREIFLLLEKREANSPVPEYLVVATARSGTLEEEINQAVQRGFRLLPRTMAAVQKKAPLLGTYGFETTVVMEKVNAVTNAPKYLVIGTKRVNTFRKELAEAEQQGYEVLGMMLSYEEQVTILAKAAR